MNTNELFRIIEALLFVSGEPLSIEDIASSLDITIIEATSAIEDLRDDYKRNERGLSVRFINGKAQLCTSPFSAPYIEKLLQPNQKRSFSQSVLETLSIIAYKQPVTRADIEGIRGVRCEYAVSQLLLLGLIREVGRKNTVGRPTLLGTTEKFLQHFNLPSIDELPHKAEILARSEE